MAALRLVAWLLVGLALALLGADVVSSLEAGAVRLRSTAAVLALAGVAADPEASGGLASLLGFFLSAPAWAVVGVVGVLLVLTFRPVD